ncbi:MAG: serine/threonine protein kinase [Anaerolineae bacterium]|nr:serine/threonine protein kinase [Anaerolineae bacterium]
MTTRPVSDDEDKLVGKQLGAYKISRLLATGGMARIYEGVDTNLGRPVAVKVLKLEDASADPTLARRFQREAKAIAKLEHDHIISVYHYGEDGGLRYLVMKLIDGKDLSQEISRLRRSGRKMDVGYALDILGQIASAIDFAHEHDVVHRDIKPSNILIDRHGHAVLTDFGLVLQHTFDSTQTQGTAFGTPRYIAPEQALASQNAVAQSDIYALAVILYEILTGEAPFSGDTAMEIALGHIGDPPRPPRTLNPKIPVGVEKELLKALEKEPARRHSTAQSFIASVRTAYEREAPDAIKGMRTTTHQPSHPTPVFAKAPKLTAEPVLEAWDIEDGSTSRLLPQVEAKKKQRGVAPWLIALAGGLALFLIWIAVSWISNPTPNRITLWYDDQSMVMYNGYGSDFNTFKWQFIRGVDGEGNDDYSGDRVDDDLIPVGECYILRTFGYDLTLPGQCKGLHNYEELQNPLRFFWRNEPVNAATFDIYYDRQLIAQCPTVHEGEQQTCTFTEPVLTPTPAV